MAGLFPAFATASQTPSGGILVDAGGLDTGQSVIRAQDQIVEKQSIFGRIGDTLGNAANGFFERAAQIGTDIFTVAFDPAFKLAQAQLAALSGSAPSQPQPSQDRQGISPEAGSALLFGGLALGAVLLLRN